VSGVSWAASKNKGVNTLVRMSDTVLASTGYRVLRFWEAETGKVRHTVKLFTSISTATPVSPNVLACCGRRGLVWLRDAEHGGDLLEALIGHEAAVKRLAMLPDGRLASADGVGKIFLWDLRTAMYTAKLELPTPSSCRSLVVAGAESSSPFLACGSSDGRLSLWDLRGGGSSLPPPPLTHTLKGFRKQLRTAAAVPTDSRVATGAAGGRVCVWSQGAAAVEGEEGGWECDVVRAAGPADVHAVRWSTTGELLVGDAKGIVSIWTPTVTAHGAGKGR
jgi:WD40 repeat protein